MIPFRPDPPASVRRPLESVVAQAQELGAPAPPWIAVEDEGGEWFRLVAGTPPAERARAVVAVASEVALLQALRLGVGGALWLPPSTPSAVEAFSAAAVRTPPTPAAEPPVLEALAHDAASFLVATVANRPFWRLQLGDCIVAALLAETTRRLNRLPLLLPWPAVVVTGVSEADLEGAWDAACAGRSAPREGLVVVRVATDAIHRGVVVLALEALAAAEAGETQRDHDETYPVCELPSGRQLGRWAPRAGRAGSRGGWLAVPDGAAGVGLAWRLEHADGTVGRACDVLSSEEIRTLSGEIPRMAGWAAGNLRSGSASALLATRLAAAAVRAGSTLWVPNVDAAAVQLLLKLGVPLWVDGPAVPEPRKAG